ncbi:MAG TPA: BON domain-containing protein [Pyrinomonadaceae bacterium]|nr:BON domain-containing protein [Pyrinomonadaceae bacterium]
MKIFTRLRPSALLALTAALVMVAANTRNVQGQDLRRTAQMQNLLERLEKNTDRLQSSMDSALDYSRFNDTDVEDQANALVDELENATDRLKDRVEDHIVNNYDVNEVLRRGLYLDMFMLRHDFLPAAERDWQMVRSDLDRMARLFAVTWTWVPGSIQNSALNKSWTKQVINRLEETTDQFRNSFDAGLDRSRIDGSAYEDFMNSVMAQFERVVDKLEDDANSSKQLASTDITLALTNAAEIDDFLRRYTLPARTRRDWARVKANLDDLAFVNRVAWDWRRRSGAAPLARNVPQAQGERVGLSMMSNRPVNAVAREVRHELLSDLPYYTVFDWIEFEVLPDNTVVLKGEVTTPPDTKSRAEAVVADVSGVSRVVNEIRVLPVSSNDARLRGELYQAIYGFNSPLFKYGVASNRAIHIIVDGGRATLKGVVDTQADKNQAYIRARGVPGIFAVNNELMVKGETMVR